MRNLLLLVWKNYFFFLFLLLETFCIYLVVQNNFYQRASFVNSSNRAAASILQTSAEVEAYFYLKNENENLSKENAELRSKLMESYSMIVNDRHTVNDTILRQKYQYTSAKVVNNSTNFRSNYITLNKGSDQGVRRDMAVITSTGIVGVVKNVSANFCTVMSLLHKDIIVSSAVKKDGSFGPLIWDGTDIEHATLTDIPTHVRLLKGDTIVTTSFSFFPANIRIGTVESWQQKAGDNFYTVDVKLLTDFKKLTYVYIVTNMMKEEQDELEKQSESDKE